MISDQKDEEYIQSFKNQLSLLLSQIFGPKKWITYRKFLNLLAPLSYHLLTSFSGKQTLGEEYTSIVQFVKDERGKLVKPSKLRTLIMIFLNVLYPLLRDEAILRCLKDMEEWQRDTVRFVLEKLNHLHLIVFLLKGTFYHVSKRLTNVRYLKYSENEYEPPEYFYQFLGLLSFIEFILSIKTAYIVKSYERQQALIQKRQLKLSSNESVSNGDKCILCFDKRKETTSTICGHLFCWNCITKWTLFKKHCPACRYPLKGGNQLIFIHNY